MGGSGGSSVVVLSSFFFVNLSGAWRPVAPQYLRARVFAKEIINRKFEGVRKILVPVHVPSKIHWVLACVRLASYCSVSDGKIRVRLRACVHVHARGCVRAREREIVVEWVGGVGACARTPTSTHAKNSINRFGPGLTSMTPF